MLNLPPGARRDCTMLAAGAAAIAAVLRPFQDAPFVDDWIYAWPVRHLLETGELAVTEYSTSPQLAQTLWGALFCLPFGFSFTALRISTWTLWVSLLWAVYLLTRELGGGRRNALAGAAAVAVNPTGFVLAFTFMTDVPFLAGLAWSAWLLVRAVQQRPAFAADEPTSALRAAADKPPLRRGRRTALVWAAAAAGAFAGATRPIGIGIAAAMFVALLFHAGRWGRSLRVLAAPVALAGFTAAVFLYGRAHVLRSADVSMLLNSPSNRLAGLSGSLQILPSTLPLTLEFVIGYGGVLLLPLAFGLVRHAPPRTVASIAAPLGAGWAVLRYLGHGPVAPLNACHTWSFAELGMAACLVPGAAHYSLPLWAEASLAVGGILLGSVILAAMRPPWRREADAFMGWLLLAQLGLAAFVWLYNFDRYALPFVVFGASFVMARSLDVAMKPMAVGLALYGAVSLLGARDHLAYSRALWTASGELRARRVPPADIDAGYVVNGWFQYTYPDQAYRDEDGNMAIPMVNAYVRLPYTVANRPLPGTIVVRTVPYTGWLYRGGELYVLRAVP